jgi:hypothetical protein
MIAQNASWWEHDADAHRTGAIRGARAGEPEATNSGDNHMTFIQRYARSVSAQWSLHVIAT